MAPSFFFHFHLIPLVHKTAGPTASWPSTEEGYFTVERSSILNPPGSATFPDDHVRITFSHGSFRICHHGQRSSTRINGRVLRPDASHILLQNDILELARPHGSDYQTRCSFRVDLLSSSSATPQLPGPYTLTPSRHGPAYTTTDDMTRCLNDMSQTYNASSPPSSRLPAAFTFSTCTVTTTRLLTRLHSEPLPSTSGPSLASAVSFRYGDFVSTPGIRSTSCDEVGGVMHGVEPQTLNTSGRDRVPASAESVSGGTSIRKHTSVPTSVLAADTQPTPNLPPATNAANTSPVLPSSPYSPSSDPTAQATSRSSLPTSLRDSRVASVDSVLARLRSAWVLLRQDVLCNPSTESLPMASLVAPPIDTPAVDSGRKFRLRTAHVAMQRVEDALSGCGQAQQPALGPASCYPVLSTYAQRPSVLFVKQGSPCSESPSRRASGITSVTSMPPCHSSSSSRSHISPSPSSSHWPASAFLSAQLSSLFQHLSTLATEIPLLPASWHLVPRQHMAPIRLR
ncbi:unnamed protein product [Tilletia laevis]|uniref:FHA domain-containing protein n=3 Tax=Tilletia TaxID=13289 RepID=A0A8X7MJ02_9BASI|nr:hypothetical protein CF336_g8625 [Tilletia laevis]KAE8238022.1 hypothetical protein A4X06_0g9023 [Tilletia controversa]KAE8240804.1 hypothetical protein A4X03_0g8343 [Tilletia caries]KAE8185309.1 hypothetical protein CF335_g7758 [Tilletia laevis]CAD6892857.1 unnamed protein product [Tilletia caries]